MRSKACIIQKRSILNMHAKIPIIYDDVQYNSMYVLMYAIGYPSKAHFIHTVPECKLYELYSDSEFEVPNEYVCIELLRCIIAMCAYSKFRIALENTRHKTILNYDNDNYFGVPNNVYGKCLMIVRDYKLYQ